MNSSVGKGTLLSDLNKERVEDLIPFFIVLGILFLFGLLGNVSLLLFIWPGARRRVGTFFLFVLAVGDILISFTTLIVFFEYKSIYIYKNNAMCKSFTFLKFSVPLFIGFLQLAIAKHRFRRICRPFGKQLDLNNAKLLTFLCLLFAVLLSFPQFFLVKSLKLEIKDYNVSGNDCIVDKYNLKWQAILMDAIYGGIFFFSSLVLFILYCFQGRAIFEANKNHVTLTLTTTLACIRRPSRQTGEDSMPVEPNMEIADTITQEETSPPSEIPKQDRKASSAPPGYARAKKRKDYISTTKVSVMFFAIALGFIVGFLPYVIYAIWRAFMATEEQIMFSVTPVNLFCLNSYLVISVINPVVYGCFNRNFRQYLKNLGLCRCKTHHINKTVS